MKNLKYISVGIILAIILTGCGKNHMVKLPESKMQKNPSSQATIEFMRSSFVAGAIGVELFEIVNGELEFIGNLPMGTKVIHHTKPGKKVYMAYGTAADFMIADIKAGEKYYSIVRPNWGTGGFAPTPVRTNGSSDYNTSIPEFKKWIALDAYQIKQPEAKIWFDKNKKKYDEIYADYWNRFQTKSKFEQAQRTLTSLDAYTLK